MPRTKLFALLTMVASLFLLIGAAWAVEPPPATAVDTLKVDYFSNAHTAGAPDATLRAINPGTTYANLCADIFVFDTNEELSECCSCTITPDGPLQLSVNTDLTGNPLTGVTLSNGVIKVLSAATTGGYCPLPSGKITPTPTLRSWVTHIQNSNFTITETVSPDASLSFAERAALQQQCNAIQKDGSGHGICANSAALASICNN